MSSNLLLSFELIYLLEWLLQYEKPRLKLFIKHAINSGLGAKIQNANLFEDSRTNEELHDTILDFIDYLEEALHDNLKEKGANTSQIRDDLSTSLKQLNLTNVDPSTIWISIKQAETEINRSLRRKPKEIVQSYKTKEILLKKILKNWNPVNKECVN